jgi:hypothetical protein
MKTLFIIKTFVLITVALLSAQAHAVGGSIAVGLNEANQLDTVQVSFVADATIETDEFSVTERIYYVPGMVRDEMQMSGQQIVFIQRYDLGILWMLMPGQNVYMESDVSQPSEQLEQYRLVEREVVGQETINGMDTTKYKVIYENSKDKFGGFTWFTDDFIAVKAFLISEEKGEKQRIQFEITNLILGPQDSSLFDLPEGFTNLDMTGMAGMNNMPGFDGGGFADRMAEAAKQAAEQEAENEVQDKVGKLFKKLFND